MVTPTDVKEYTYSVSGWKDRLVTYDGHGISYDMVGNPWNYRGHNLEWSRIRLLTKWDSIEMDYNASGIRTRKGDTYYELDGDTIISETTCGDTIRYYYGNGGIVGFRHNGTRYYYEKNLQGDIVGIYDASGSKVAGYVYDAWGNCTITTNVGGIASVNPFRYRGYYYDSDIGLYYLKSRYYDAQVARFINADSLNYLGANRDLAAYNLFAYCSNKPTRFKDPSGHSVFGILATLAALVLAGLGLNGCSNNVKSHIGPTNTKLTDDIFDSYEAALKAANESVFSNSILYAGYVDRNGEVYEHGVEYSADIYYDTINENYRITLAYTMGKETENKYLELLNNDGTFIMLGYTHFHPDTNDMSLVFSQADLNMAETLAVACHIVNANNETAHCYEYMADAIYDYVIRP